jgi:hypothetical protein
VVSFDSIPHAELLQSVARRIVDGAMLHLIKMWLEAPVEETQLFTGLILQRLKYPDRFFWTFLAG